MGHMRSKIIVFGSGLYTIGNICGIRIRPAFDAKAKIIAGTVIHHINGFPQKYSQGSVGVIFYCEILGQITEIELSNWGEVFLNPGLKEIFKVAKKYVRFA